MRIRRKYSLLPALALFLALIAKAPASAAQPQGRRLPRPVQAADLRAPVTEGELQTFVQDFTTLVRAIHDLNPNRPDVQDRMVQVEQEIATFNSEQLTMLANTYDRPALSQAVQRLKSLMPTLSGPEQGGATPQADLAVAGSNRPRPDDGSTSPANPTLTTLTLASYSSTCTPTSFSALLGGPIPSDSDADYGVFVGLQTANAAQIPLNFVCEELNVVGGDGTNVPDCTIAATDQAVAYALQVSLSTLEYCDAFVLGAENDAAYANTIAIYNNLASGTATLNNHITAIDTDIVNHVSGVTTAVDANLSAVDTDIDNHVAVADLDIDTKVANSYTALSGQLTAVNNHLTSVDNDVLADGTDVTTLQALDLRMEIEKSLALQINVGLFQTPKAQGGYLELVASIVQTVINGLTAAGQNCGSAQTLLNQGNTYYAAKLYKKAYASYMSAYQAATH